MPTHITIKKFLVILKMPRKIGDKIIRLNDIKNKITLSSYFTGTGWTATVTLAQFGLDIGAYIAAVTDVKNHVAGAVGVRTSTFVTVKDIDIEQLMAMVKDKARANLSLAEAIILSAGFFTQVVHVKQKLTDDAFNTEIAGLLLLTGAGGGPHEFQMSKDKINIIHLDPSTTATTHVPGNSVGVPPLIVGDTWFFRMRKVNTKKRTFNWCKWIELKIGAGGRNLGGIVIHGLAGNMPTQ
ncbi:MAG: hypothetical protein ACYDCN_11615 [Bacteroidia bacterium]